MEEPTTQPTAPSVDNAQKQKQSKKKAVGIALVILLIIIIPLVLFLTRSQIIQMPFSQPTNQADQVIAKVGAETLYYKDVAEIARADNYSYIAKNEVEKYKNDSKVLVNMYLPKTIDESVLLQEGKTQNLIEDLPKDVFNTKTKNYAKRKELVAKIRQEVDKNIKKIDVETLNIYYSNPTSSASAKQAMEQYRVQIASGTLTFQQVGEKIASNKALTQLSPYNKEPYALYKNVVFNQRIYGEPKLNDTLFTQKPGTLSPTTELISVRRIRNGTFEQLPVGYTLFRVISTTGSYTQGFDGWLASIKQKYTIKQLL